MATLYHPPTHPPPAGDMKNTQTFLSTPAEALSDSSSGCEYEEGVECGFDNACGRGVSVGVGDKIGGVGVGVGGGGAGGGVGVGAGVEQRKVDACEWKVSDLHRAKFLSVGVGERTVGVGGGTNVSKQGVGVRQEQDVGGNDSGCEAEEEVVGGDESQRMLGTSLLIGEGSVRASESAVSSVREGGKKEQEQGGQGTVPGCSFCGHEGASGSSSNRQEASACSTMKHKCGAIVINQHHHHQQHYHQNNNIKPHATTTMAASDITSDTTSTTSVSANTYTGGGGGSGGGGGGSGAPLRSALKRAGQKSRGHRVCINEAKNECLEADYVILVHDESEPQIVSIRNLDLSLASASGSTGSANSGSTAGPPELTLSPPEGYKDCFSHHIEDSDTESGSGDGLGESEGGRPHLPDLVTHRTLSLPTSSGTELTVENVRHHDQLMLGRESREAPDPTLAKTGILKGGKLWRNGERRGSKGRLEEEEEEPRRSVRFSGRDEYSLLESLPLDAANSVALARVMPKLRELGVLLADPRPNDWHLELSPITPEPDTGITAGHPADIPDDQPPTPPPPPPPQMDDEQIRESMQRYDEMRRRIAAAEGRDNTSVCSDESKSSSDSQSSDSTMTETRIRRLENTDVAHVAGGVMRSNSEVRRAIERNALRRSLIRFSEARKKDTNKNDKSEKGETSLLEKLKWLTASEDATNGNSETKDDGDAEEGKGEGKGEGASCQIDPKVQDTIAQYRKLAEMFNKTTALRATEIMVPGDVREWKLKADLFPSGQGSQEGESEDATEPLSGTATPTVLQGVPVDLGQDDDTEKLIYSGGVRYTREGTLPPADDDDDDDDDDPEGDSAAPSPPTTTAEARKQFLAQMAAPTISLQVNGAPAHPGDRSSLVSNSDSYSFEDIDEALHDDRSSSVASSSQSSPRLSGKSDVDGTSTTESGYSSNETNGELQCPLNGLPLTAASLHTLPFSLPNVDIDELAEFVRQDAERLERLRRRYDGSEMEDHGFTRRPSVRGIKTRFGSTIDLLKQMATQLAPPPASQPGLAGSHMTWPYRDAGDEDPGTGSSSGLQRRRATPSRGALPSLQEDMLYVPTSDLSPQAQAPTTTSLAPPTSLSHLKAPRTVHVYSSTGDMRPPPPPRLSVPRESPPPDLIRPGGGPMPPARATITHISLEGPLAGMIVAPQMPTPAPYDHHIPPCRRPASVHGHLPADSLVNRGAPPPPATRPHSSLSHYPPPRVPTQYPLEEPLPTRTPYEGGGHPVLTQRGSYPGTLPASHYQPPLGPPDPVRYVHPPPYGSQHSHQRPASVTPREVAPLPRANLPQVLPLPQVSMAGAGAGPALHQCGPRHPRAGGGGSGSGGAEACSPVWAHPHHPMYFPPPPTTSHFSYTTPIVPETAQASSRPPGPPMPAPLAMGPPLMNGGMSKLEALRDERGVPEGASSSPRGPLDPQYPPSHGSPTRDTTTLLPRHPPLPLNIT